MLGETPLHLALTSPELDPSPDDDDDEGGLREAVVDSLLDAGLISRTPLHPYRCLFVCFGFLINFNFKRRIEEAAGRTAQSIAAKNKSLAALFQKAQLNASIARDDIADDDDDGEPLACFFVYTYLMTGSE